MSHHSADPGGEIRVLYLEMNEDGTTGGSHVVMRDIIERIPAPYRPLALFYQTNPVGEQIARHGIDVVNWDAIRTRERAAMESSPMVVKPWLLWREIWRRRMFITKHGIRLVHLGNSPIIGGDAWLPACVLAGVPCVVYSMGRSRARIGLLRRRLYRRYARILPNSRYLADDIANLGYPTERIVLAYPGLDFAARPALPTSVRADVRAEFGVRADQALVVMVGNIREWKGQHLLVDAVRRLTPAERTRARVLLVGEVGPANSAYHDQLERVISTEGLQKVITFTGKRHDVDRLFAGSDIAVHASTIPEPFGLVVLEAMAAGCAVIAARDGGPSEMLDTDCGLLVDTTDGSDALLAALRTLLDDPSRRAAMGARAAVRARQFDIRDHVRIVQHVYDELLGRPR